MKHLYILLFISLLGAQSFSQVIFTEIADPNNDANARYIELHNLGSTTIDFAEGNGWQIDKYLNGNSGVSETLDLTGTIDPGGFYIIAYDVTPGTFQSVYGFTPDQLDAVNNGVVGSNGDDDLALVNGADTIVDFFGIYDFSTDTNTDNSGTCAEYEDGRAERLTTVTSGNINFDESEWNIWADTTVSGCTSHQNAPRTAPSDFDPGAWGTATCELTIINANTTCDSFTTGATSDTYTATIDFTGGGTSTYTITPSSGTIDLSMGNPSSDTSGTITITGVAEGSVLTVTIQDGALCDIESVIASPICEPSLNLPIYEAFDYNVGEDLSNQTNWTGFNTGDSVTIGGPGGLTYPGLANDTQAGNHVSFDGSGQESGIEFTDISSGAVYASFIIQVTDLSAITDLTDGGYFAALANSNSSYDLRCWVRPNTDPVASTFDIAIGVATSSPTFIGNYDINTPVLIVMSYEPGTGVVKGWVNPALDGTEPTPDFSETDTDIETVIDRFVLRQDSPGETPAILLDELRLGLSYDDVTPQTLSNNDFSYSPFSLSPNPTATGYVNISTANKEIMKVSVFDLLGKQVISQTLHNNRLDVSNLKNGIYMLRLSQGNTIVTKKLIIR